VSKTFSKFTAGARYAVAIVLVTGLVFVGIEGLTSTAISLFQMLRGSSEPTVFRYDQLLGWANVPDAYVPDMYGPGKYLRTNARGFRNDGETEVTIPEGKLRIICTGDSFTFGQGVANNRSWCHGISELDHRFETANLGEPGYGIDQMFLRYKREALALEHSVHIFAFVRGDLDRMAFQSKNGYGKPILKLSRGALVVRNVPVPRFRWWATRAMNRADFRSVDFGRRVLAKLFPPPPNTKAQWQVETLERIERWGPIASRVFQTVQQLSDDKNIVSLFVYLPTEQDLQEPDPSWHRWTVETMNAMQLPFVDLSPALRSLPAGRAGSFFIVPPSEDQGHYTEAGNNWVAAMLHARLMKIPRVRVLLSK
jgi:hypothetical protein